MTLKTLAAAACVTIAAATAGSAATITVGGQDFNIDTVTGTFLENEATLIQNIFFGNDELAAQFATAFGVSDPLPNGTIVGPSFAFTTLTNSTGEAIVASQIVSATDLGFGNIFTSGAFSAGSLQTTSAVFAIATPVSAVPLPAGGLLLLTGLGGVAALKRRKKRAA